MSQKFYWGELNVVKRLNNFHSLHKTPRDIKDCETFIFLPVSCSIVEHKRWFIASGRQILLTYWGQNLHSGQQKVQTVHRNPSLDIWQCFFQEILTLNVPRCSRIGGILINRSLFVEDALVWFQMLLLLSVSLLIILLSIAPLIFQGAITAITEAIIANGIAANMAYAAPVVLYFIIFTSVIFSCDKEKKGYLMLFNALFWLMSRCKAIIRFFFFCICFWQSWADWAFFFISESSQRKRICMKIIQMSKLRICFFASCSKICTSLPPLHRNGENWSSEENAGEEVMKFTFEQIQPSRKTYSPMFFC